MYKQKDSFVYINKGRNLQRNDLQGFVLFNLQLFIHSKKKNIASLFLPFVYFIYYFFYKDFKFSLEVLSQLHVLRTQFLVLVQIKLTLIFLSETKRHFEAQINADSWKLTETKLGQFITSCGNTTPPQQRKKQGNMLVVWHKKHITLQHLNLVCSGLHSFQTQMTGANISTYTQKNTNKKPVAYKFDK